MIYYMMNENLYDPTIHGPYVIWTSTRAWTEEFKTKTNCIVCLYHDYRDQNIYSWGVLSEWPHLKRFQNNDEIEKWREEHNIIFPLSDEQETEFKLRFL